MERIRDSLKQSTDGPESTVWGFTTVSDDHGSPNTENQSQWRMCYFPVKTSQSAKGSAINFDEIGVWQSSAIEQTVNHTFLHLWCSVQCRLDRDNQLLTDVVSLCLQG